LKTTKRIKFVFAFLCCALIFLEGYGQTYFGFKAGVNATKVTFESEDYKKFYDSKITPGLLGGIVFLVENRDKYGFYTEFLYSVNGKSVESHANDYETNKATYRYLEIPVLFRMKFKQKQFNWFLQFGPEIKYWLSGNGAFEVYEPDRDVITTYEYKINFGDDKNSSDYMNVVDANRVQLGVAFGGGFIWDLKNANYLSLDVRYSLGNTFMGGYESGSIPNIGLVDNFEHTNNALSVSAVYYFDIREKLRLSKNKYRKK
jgi:hypothetical protein